MDLIVILGFIALMALLSAAEVAVVACSKAKLHDLAADGHARARTVLAVRERPEHFLAAVKIGITVLAITAGAFSASRLSLHVSAWLSTFEPLREWADTIAVGAMVVVVTFLVILLGELLPRSLAVRKAERYAMLAAGPVLAFSVIARPFIWLVTAIANLLLRPWGVRTTFSGTRYSAEELQELVDEAARAGTVHPQAGEIASRALEFPELVAADVMIPRKDVVMIPRHAPPEEVRRILLEDTHTRMPVFEGTLDNVVGYVSVKDLLAFAWEQKLIVLEDVLRPAYFVPESQRAVDLLQDMRKRQHPFAIVVDEQGGISGILTMEDLIEELVGDIFSEHARQGPVLIVREAPGMALVRGAAPIREVNRTLDLDLPEQEGFTTIAGLCLALAGRIPSVGEKLQLPDGISLEVVDASPRHIRAVRVRKADG